MKLSFYDSFMYKYLHLSPPFFLSNRIQCLTESAPSTISCGNLGLISSNPPLNPNTGNFNEVSPNI